MKELAMGALAVLGAAWIGAAPARAAIIIGLFTGTAIGSRVNAQSANPGSFDGTPVTVTYNIDTSVFANPVYVDVQLGYTTDLTTYDPSPADIAAVAPTAGPSYLVTHGHISYYRRRQEFIFHA